MNTCLIVLIGALTLSLGSCDEVIEEVELQQKQKEEGCGVVEKEDLTQVVDPEPPNVFKAKCATCHSYNKDATGPALKGFMKKAPSEDWFKAFIRNQGALIEQGDSLAIAIQKQRPSKGQHFQDLSTKEFNALIYYLK